MNKKLLALAAFSLTVLTVAFIAIQKPEESVLEMEVDTPLVEGEIKV